MQASNHVKADDFFPIEDAGRGPDVRPDRRSCTTINASNNVEDVLRLAGHGDAHLTVVRVMEDP